MTTTDLPILAGTLPGMQTGALRELLLDAAPVDAALDANLHPVRDVDADPALAAIALDGYFPVLADCGHVEDYGQAVQTQCDLRLCGDCHAEHRCTPCDADARACGED